jgi:hypothetical protein
VTCDLCVQVLGKGKGKGKDKDKDKDKDRVAPLLN